MKKLGLNHRPTFRKNYLQPALDGGLIERTLPDKPNSSLQRYRLRQGARLRPLPPSLPDRERSRGLRLAGHPPRADGLGDAFKLHGGDLGSAWTMARPSV